MTTPTVPLPAELAPAQRTRVLDLLRQVSPVPEVPALDRSLRQAPTFNRCVVCRRSGVLGGHHDTDGRVVWIHRSCHRRLHRRGRPRRRPTSTVPAYRHHFDPRELPCI